MIEELKKTYKKVALDYYANDNSLHSLGFNSKKLEDTATKQIIDCLGLVNKEIVYTSDKSEADTLCIFGYLNNNLNNKHVIVEKGVNDSIIESLKVLENNGFSFSVVDKFSLDCIKENTVLICFKNDASFDDKDIKTYIDFNDCDIKNINNYSFISLGLDDISNYLGIACLIKNKNIVLEPVIHGGKSTTIYRGGTPVLPSIVTFSKAIKLMYKK